MISQTEIDNIQFRLKALRYLTEDVNESAVVQSLMFLEENRDILIKPIASLSPEGNVLFKFRNERGYEVVEFDGTDQVRCLSVEGVKRSVCRKKIVGGMIVG